jgi:hypothetical protein
MEIHSGNDFLHSPRPMLLTTTKDEPSDSPSWVTNVPWWLRRSLTLDDLLVSPSHELVGTASILGNPI